MERKLVKQGDVTLMVSLPSKWIKHNSLKQGDAVHIEEQQNNTLSILATEPKKEFKRIELHVDSSHFNIQRGLIGALYRAGYDEIKVTFKDRRILSELQKTVDSLFGFEIFDIHDSYCLIKSVFTEEESEIESHVKKMIHIVNTMQSIINEDIEHKKFQSENELLQFRNNILKQRDIISRIVIQRQIVDDKKFPFYLISFNLWNIARNYYNLYTAISQGYKITSSDKEFFQKTISFFSEFFQIKHSYEFSERHHKYRELTNQGRKFMKSKDVSIVKSYCLNILMLVQSCNSQLLLVYYQAAANTILAGEAR